MEVRQFVHRKNDDGSWDSICTFCFLTASTATQSGELKDGEAHHRCGDAVSLRKIQEQLEESRS